MKMRITLDSENWQEVINFLDHVSGSNTRFYPAGDLARQIEAALPHAEEIDPNRCDCGGYYERVNYCGAWVCIDCGDHRGLARCYCGWSKDGGNGRAQLEEMGETIEPEDY